MISVLFKSVNRPVLSSVALVAAAAGAGYGEVCGSRVDLLRTLLPYALGKA